MAVGDPTTLLDRLCGRLAPDGGSVLVGFDFPIGLPLALARAAGFDSFVCIVEKLGRGEWASFFDVHRTVADISLHRPFYPLGNGVPAGSVQRTHLHDALGLTREELLRRCDRLTGAEVLFWTLGATQVGKGPLIGWQEVLQPGLGRIRLWPFDGPLLELLAPAFPSWPKRTSRPSTINSIFAP